MEPFPPLRTPAFAAALVIRRYPPGMDAFFAVPVLLLPAAILWLIIYSAVRTALRHEKDRTP